MHILYIYTLGCTLRGIYLHMKRYFMPGRVDVGLEAGGKDCAVRVAGAIAVIVDVAVAAAIAVGASYQGIFHSWACG